MKTILMTVAMLVISATVTFAQCGKNLLLESSKTEYLDASGTIQKTVEEKSVIEISKSEVIIIPGGNEEKKMTGTIKSDSCSWKVPLKDGKTFIKATLSNSQGDTKEVTFTIEGKDGKITFLMEMVEMPDKKIRVVVDKFEEKQ